MNKIYKVLWNYATQTWVVTSEMGKAHKKTKSQVDKVKSPSLIALAAVGGVLLGSQAMAAVAIGNGQIQRQSSDTATASASGVANAQKIGSIAIGEAANNSPGENNVACATQAASIAIGMGAKAIAVAPAGDQSGKRLDAYSQAIAIGRAAQAKGDQALALGADTRANGHSSIAIGGDDLDSVAGVKYQSGGTAWNSVSQYSAVNSSDIAQQYKRLTGQDLVNLTQADIGKTPDSGSIARQYQATTSGNAAVAIGVSAVAKDLSTSFGTRTYAENIATALGVGANASKVNSVALGAGSTTQTNAVLCSSCTKI